MFAAYKTRKIFLIGAATYEHAKYVCDKKGMDMVLYLRAKLDAAEAVHLSTYTIYSALDKALDLAATAVYAASEAYEEELRK